MQRDAESHAAEDKQKRELAEARNTAEQRVYQLEKLLEENKDKLSESDQSAAPGGDRQGQRGQEGRRRGRDQPGGRRAPAGQPGDGRASLRRAGQAGAGGGAGAGPGAGGAVAQRRRPAAKARRRHRRRVRGEEVTHGEVRLSAVHASTRYRPVQRLPIASPSVRSTLTSEVHSWHFDSTN